MNRLTELYTDLEIEIHNSEPEARHLEKGDFRPKNNALLSDCVQKLGQLEDIEEELGVDLITLIKALKDGIYTKEYGHLTVISVGLGGLISEVHSIDYYKDVFYYSGYGKTWALTKEELKK